MPNDYRCPRCTADPQPPQHAPRKCLFHADGSFSEENWNCAAEWALQASLEESVYAAYGLAQVYGNDETMSIYPCFPDALTPKSDDNCYPFESRGWLVFTRYKRRGRASNAVWVGDFAPARPVTRELVEATIAGLQHHTAPEAVHAGAVH